MVVAASANAVTAFSNYGPGDSFVSSAGWTIGESTEQRVASQFTSAASGQLDYIKLTLFAPTPGLVNVILHEDNNDTVGNGIQAWGITPASNDTTYTLNNPFPSTVLTAGTKYWLEVRAFGTSTHVAWNFNDQGNTLPTSFANGNGAFGSPSVTDAGVFEVAVVPEPASLTVLALASLAALKRRKK